MRFARAVSLCSSHPETCSSAQKAGKPEESLRSTNKSLLLSFIYICVCVYIYDMYTKICIYNSIMYLYISVCENRDHIRYNSTAGGPRVWFLAWANEAPGFRLGYQEGTLSWRTCNSVWATCFSSCTVFWLCSSSSFRRRSTSYLRHVFFAVWRLLRQQATARSTSILFHQT